MKVQDLVLYLGYVESQSFSCLLMHHVHGFDSLQEAFADIHDALGEYLRDEIKAQKDRFENAKAHQNSYDYVKSLEKGLLQLLNYDIGDIFVQFFRGWGGQDGNIFVWEYLNNYGWEIGGMDFNFANAICIDSAEEAVVNPGGWSMDNSDSYNLYPKPTDFNGNDIIVRVLREENET